MRAGRPSASPAEGLSFFLESAAASLCGNEHALPDLQLPLAWNLQGGGCLNLHLLPCLQEPVDFHSLQHSQVLFPDGLVLR